MSQFLNKQSGMSTISWLAVIILIVLVAAVGIKLVPHYVDNLVVSRTIKSLPNEDGFFSKTKREILLKIRDRLNMDNIKIDNKNIQIIKNNGEVAIDINYEIREQLFFNVDVILVFTNQYHLKASDL